MPRKQKDEEFWEDGRTEGRRMRYRREWKDSEDARKVEYWLKMTRKLMR